MLHLVRRRFDLLGVGEPATVAEKKKRVVWDGGCLAAGSMAAVVHDMMGRTEPEIIGSMNAGTFYLVNLGGDGSASLTLRVIDFVEPMLPSREFAKTLAVSDVGWLNIEDGVLMAGAAETLEDGAQLAVAPGRYLVRLFSIGSISSSRLVFVACRSHSPVEALRGVPAL
ncbi:unnamed protein product [Phaeothamnion confervicola]